MKRMTDTRLWEKPWFRKMTPSEKCAWRYLIDRCDNVGVWEADTELAEFYIGDSIDWEAFREKLNGNVEVLEGGKWWVVDFCLFQHPDLDEESGSNAIRSYIDLLKKHGLWEMYLERKSGSVQGSMKGRPTLDEGSKGKSSTSLGKERLGKGKGKEESASEKNSSVLIEINGKARTLNGTRWANLIDEVGERLAMWALQERVDWEDANGKKAARDYAAATANWIKKAREFGNLPEFASRKSGPGWDRDPEVDNEIAAMVRRNYENDE